jgi:uncharacterized membrane protein YdjX (TVP38/TMEM64 family)
VVTSYAAINTIGSIPVVIALWTGGVFDREPTIGLLMVLLAITGLLAMWRASRRERRTTSGGPPHRVR